MASRHCAESYEAAGTRKWCWWGLTRSRSASVLRSRGDVISEGSAWIILCLFFSLAPSLLFVVSFSFLCVFGFAFGSSREAKTSILHLFLFWFRFPLFFFYARVRVSLDSSVRRLMEESSLFLHLASFPRLVSARIRAKFRFVTIETLDTGRRGRMSSHKYQLTSKISKVDLRSKIPIYIYLYLFKKSVLFYIVANKTLTLCKNI